jgi:hypothetical protein
MQQRNFRARRSNFLRLGRHSQTDCCQRSKALDGGTGVLKKEEQFKKRTQDGRFKTITIATIPP